ncbi:NUDIX domain-containing protein [uncultured Victivallis sp.]|uniref:NUDIX hydrolase n=1 Tax=uncultured Victivallis sp. TaxID=354118 RepID=UPI0025F0B05C|nr:NUDIX domain-containing protein [uncultured Victivallis sp.]
MAEYFDIYDEAGNRVGRALRSECHGNPALLHHTSHVVIFHPDGERILLQKRSSNKDIQPGKWDTAVGGHVDCGEDYLTAARRELREELGVADFPGELRYLFDSKIRNAIESEDVRVYGLTSAGPFRFQAEEIDEIRFWTKAELSDPANRELFTPNLVAELEMLRERGLL